MDGREFPINGLMFRMTCGACPEQYDVYFGEAQVGYIRLRHGHLTVSVPDYGGDCVLETSDFQGDGLFSNSNERVLWLRRAADAITDRLVKQVHEAWDEYDDDEDLSV